jgi:hypothetical protein
MTTNGIGTVQCVYFSPTGTTRRTGGHRRGHRLPDRSTHQPHSPRVTRRLGRINQGRHLNRWRARLLGGHPLPPPGSPQQAQRTRRWAVPVAVYGVRSAENTVGQLSGLLRTRGFRILAAARARARWVVSNPGPIYSGESGSLAKSKNHRIIIPATPMTA